MLTDKEKEQNDTLMRYILQDKFHWVCENDIGPDTFLEQGIPEDEVLDALVACIHKSVQDEFGLDFCPCCIREMWIEWLDWLELNDDIDRLEDELE